MGIERDLHDLLFCHDCVIVPQWGGFLTHYRPARLDEARKLIHPPGKDLSFNRPLVRNDGLLADHVAKREGIGFDQATARIDAEVEGWRKALDRQGRLELDRIGIFYRDAEHNLQFDPDRQVNYLRDAYGLRPLPAAPVKAAQSAPQREAAAVLPESPPAERAEQRNAGRYWLAAAAFAALVIGAAAVLAYRSGLHEGSGWPAMAGWKPRPAPSYQPSAEAGFVPVNVPESFRLPSADSGVHEVVLDAEKDVRVKVDFNTTPVAVADTTKVVVRAAVRGESPALRYHVVGGCFAQPENADRMLSELLAQGFPARRLRQRGVLHPVAYGSYATRADALAALDAVRAQGGRSAWLLVR
jgi:hypothetical protein